MAIIMKMTYFSSIHMVKHPTWMLNIEICKLCLPIPEKSKLNSRLPIRSESKLIWIIHPIRIRSKYIWIGFKLDLSSEYICISFLSIRIIWNPIGLIQIRFCPPLHIHTQRDYMKKYIELECMFFYKFYLLFY